MKPLELQVGKSYRNRKGEVIKIVERGTGIWCWIGYDEDGCKMSYTYDGLSIGTFFYNINDLIEEVTELNTKPMKLTDES